MKGAAVLIASFLVIQMLGLGVALGSSLGDPQKSTMTTLPDGSISIESYIKNDGLKKFEFPPTTSMFYLTCFATRPRTLG